MADFIKVANSDELRPGECKVVAIEGANVALYNVDGQFYATENRCPHRGGPLGDGDLDGDIVTCPWHQWQFNVKTGENLIYPASKVQTFEVKLVNEAVQIKKQGHTLPRNR